MSSPPLPRLANFRDLGGLPTDDGGATRPGVLYRSDAPRPGDEWPSEALIWPPTRIIDLRTAEEIGERHPLTGASSSLTARSLLASARPPSLAELRAGARYDVAPMYAEILDSVRDQAAAIMDDVVGTPPPTLVHCTAGKERTGVLVAVLLRAAGVTASAVIADYARTTAAMEGVRARLPYDESVEELIREFPEVLAAPRDAIRDVLRGLEGHAGGIPGWLVENGVEREVLTTWRRRLVARGGPPGPQG